MTWSEIARRMAYMIAISGGLVLIVGFTILPSISDLAAQFIGLGCGVVGLVGSFGIEEIHRERLFRRELERRRQAAIDL